VNTKTKSTSITNSLYVSGSLILQLGIGYTISFPQYLYYTITEVILVEAMCTKPVLQQQGFIVTVHLL